MLRFRALCIPDPSGHNENLLLKGDWIILEISDSGHCGRGEASHSGDDAQVIEAASNLFSNHIRSLDLSHSAIQELEQGPFSAPQSFIEATAMSALDQALHELLAKREGVPVWRLFANEKQRNRVQAYATVNRALTSRTPEDYEETASLALRQGFRAIKCAPFDAVTSNGHQIRQSQEGLRILRHLRDRFPDLSVRVDFHERFHLREFLTILPQLEALSLHWLEAPIPIGTDYRHVMQACETKIALGELLYGAKGFSTIVEQRWADVIMPDVKHVGGVGPLVRLAHRCKGAMEVSPHHPSGPVAALASAHVCISQDNVGALELPLITDPARAYYSKWLLDGFITLPLGDGWGRQSDLPDVSGSGFLGA